MNEQVWLGVIAIIIGVAIGIVLFVPFVAIAYRRHGGLTLGRFILWAAALVYFLAIWTYTLLPLPDPDAISCAGTNLNLMAFVDDIRGAIARPGNTLRDPAFLQLALNVVLFVPLGFFLRVLGGRGILVALFVGLGISVFIETTQLTGVWGVYPCAYRVFDVDDMLTNTTGAVLGSVLSLVVPKHLRGSKAAADAGEPRPVTRGRRFVDALCDFIAVMLVEYSIGLGVQIWLLSVQGWEIADASPVSSFVSIAATAGIWLIVVLVTGRTIGDLAVQLEYRGGPLPVWLARILRYLGGIGGFVLLGLVPGGGLLQPFFALAWFTFLFLTRGSRGLPGLLSAQDLTDARTPR